MQLVLGAQIETGLGAAGAPQPAPPERRRLGEPERRILRRAAWIAAFALLSVLGALQGATVAIGAHGLSELASAAPRGISAAPHTPPARESGRVFWRPDESPAQRPPSKISPRSWKPTRSR